MQSDKLQRHWGQRLRELRQERGLTLRKLDELSGVDYRHLQKAELGRAGLSDESRLRIAAALDINPNDLWSYPAEVA